jgi:hypothetical protein
VALSSRSFRSASSRSRSAVRTFAIAEASSAACVVMHARKDQHWLFSLRAHKAYQDA